MAVGLNSGLCVHGKCKLVVQAYKQKQNEDEKKKKVEILCKCPVSFLN